MIGPTPDTVLSNAVICSDSESVFQTLFEHAGIGIVLGDRDRRMIDCNPAFAKFLGYDKESLLKLQVADFTHPDDLPADEGYFQELCAGVRDHYRLEKRYMRRDGAHVWGHLTVSRNRGKPDGKVYVIGMVQDINHAKCIEAQMRRLNEALEDRVKDRTAQLEQMAESLRASEEQFRAVAETAADAIVSADSCGNIIYFNPAAENMFGCEANDALGRPLTALMPDQFHDQHRHGLQRVVETGEARMLGKTIVMVGKTQSGQEFPLELSLASWQTGRGRFFTAIIRDISARRQAEEQIRTINMQLAATNKELEAFSYSVSHDLRAPLRSMDGFSEALLADYADKLDAQGRDYLRRVRMASKRMGELIDDLLKLSHVTRQKIHQESVDLSAMAKDIFGHLGRLQPERWVDCIIPEGLTAVGDPQLMRIVLENLFNNAWKFTGMRTKTRIEFGSCIVSRGAEPERAFFVRDNGVGFDADYAHKLFGAFQRLHGADEFAGHGIGLATVQRIIHRHGGQVWAIGAVEKGATVYFTLPAEGRTP